MAYGRWSPNDSHTSNFREMMAVREALRHFYREKRIEAGMTVRIRSDNTSVTHNLNRVCAAPTLLFPLRLIMTFLENGKMHVIVTHVPGIQNSITDQLSRLERSGDYGVTQTVCDQGLRYLNIAIDVDLFANHENRKYHRYMSISQDEEAPVRDAFSQKWNGYCPLIHPPIPLILRCLRKVEEEGVRGVMVIPCWRGQFWTNLLNRMTVKRVNLGESNVILQPGRQMKRCGTRLPPGTMEMCLVDARMRSVGTIGNV
jgi:hypothetical protein